MKLGLLKELKDKGWSEMELKNLILFEKVANKILKEGQNGKYNR